jgi:MarR family transcriptional regulator, temperature-dependent positive regulator of motility
MTDIKTSGEFALSQSVSHLLHRAQQLAADWFTKKAGDDGVTLRQFAVLAAIAEKPGQSQTDLVRATGVDRSTLADMIGRMEKRGWVTRKTAAKDARAKSVTLTAAGRKTLAAATPFAQGADEAVLAAVPKARREMFLTTLEALASTAEAAAEVAAEKPAKPAKAPKAPKAPKAEKVAKAVKASKAAKPAKPAAKAPVTAAAKPARAPVKKPTKVKKPRK